MTPAHRFSVLASVLALSACEGCERPTANSGVPELVALWRAPLPYSAGTLAAPIVVNGDVLTVSKSSVVVLSRATGVLQRVSDSTAAPAAGNGSSMIVQGGAIVFGNFDVAAFRYPGLSEAWRLTPAGKSFVRASWQTLPRSAPWNTHSQSGSPSAIGDCAA